VGFVEQARTLVSSTLRQQWRRVFIVEQEDTMYIGYDIYFGTAIMSGSNVGCWLYDLNPNLDVNVSVWIVPGTVDPLED
jgi:hypothetical protein